MNFQISSFEPGFAKALYVLSSLIGTAGTPPVATLQSICFRESLELVRALYNARIPIMAGTDKGLPAHNLHRELELYVEAGIPPMDVIRIATAGAGRIMHLEEEVGKVEVGKRADMILVDGNPLDDFSALRKVSRVITNGRMYETSSLWRSVDFRP